MRGWLEAARLRLRDRKPQYLFVVIDKTAPRQNLLLPVLAPAPGQHLSLCRPARLHQDRPGPSPRRPHSKPAHVHPLQRRDPLHAAQAAHGQPPPYRHPPHGLLPGTGHRAYAAEQDFPLIPCNLCGTQDNLARQRVKRLIEELAGENRKIPSNILNALGNLQASQLMDKRHWPFKELEKELLPLESGEAPEQDKKKGMGCTPDPLFDLP